jgi:hypothetical protein
VKTVTHDGTLVFPSRDAAEAYLAGIDPEIRAHLRVVEVVLVTPNVGSPLDSATLERVDPLVPNLG